MEQHYLKKKFFNRKGFTLLEFIVVISVVVIFLCFVPVFSGVSKGQKLYSTALMIAQDIRLAQQLNMNQDAVYTVLFDCQNDRYFIHKDISLYKEVNLPAGIDLLSTNFDFDDKSYGCDHKLRFNTKGEPFRKNGVLCGGHLSLYDHNGNYRYVIVASVTGRVRIDSSPPP